MADKKTQSTEDATHTDLSRRRLLGAACSGLAVASVAGISPQMTRAAELPVVRWGFVGTGGIANSMAVIVARAPSADLIASSSRRMESAKAFAEKHGARRAFDSWQEMVNWDGIDAVYVATPTSVREEICVAAANAGKHVLGEKPFASHPSLLRIIAACDANGVAFMDGTHFAHHPRTLELKSGLNELVGTRRTVDSVFQFPLTDTNNIRLQPRLEPMGAIGDAGWYNMRAIVEYLGDDIEVEGLRTYLRRDHETGAAVGASGVIAFTNGSSSTWNCGFDAGAVLARLRIDGVKGSTDIDNFLSQDRDGSGSYRFRSGGWWVEAADERIRVESSLPGAALMFEDFAAQVHEPSLRAQWARDTQRTQALLDAVWGDALRNEAS